MRFCSAERWFSVDFFLRRSFYLPDRAARLILFQRLVVGTAFKRQGFTESKLVQQNFVRRLVFWRVDTYEPLNTRTESSEIENVQANFTVAGCQRENSAEDVPWFEKGQLRPDSIRQGRRRKLQARSQFSNFAWTPSDDLPNNKGRRKREACHGSCNIDEGKRRHGFVPKPEKNSDLWSF